MRNVVSIGKITTDDIRIKTAGHRLWHDFSERALLPIRDYPCIRG